MFLQSNVCLYNKSSKCYWIIVLLVCINFWLISRLKISQSELEQKGIKKLKSVLPVIIKPSLTPHSTNLHTTETKRIKRPLDSVGNIFESEIIDVSLGRFDFSRKYKMFDNVIVGDNYLNLSIEYDVTLATQSSLDKLHWISHIVR